MFAMFDSVWTYVVGIALAAACTVAGWTIHPSKAPLPPGPPGRGLSGNVHQITNSEYWKIFKAWSDVYGPIVYYRIYRHKTVVLNDIKSVTDLLETRSYKYSDRPHTWMYHELVGMKLSVFTISSQHKRFKIYRRLLHKGLNARAVEDYYPLLLDETEALLQRFSEAPQNFISHFRRYSGAVILKLAYGWTVTQNNDPFVRIVEDAFVLDSYINKPGRWMVDFFPLLRFIPPQLPGAGFRRQAEEFKKEMHKVDEIPFQWAKQQIESGRFLPSFTSQYLVPEDGRRVDQEEQDIINWCASALYAAGSDTTVAFMTAFIAAMTLFPHVQQCAQKEVDEHFEREKAPSPVDQASLPYVSALIKEVLRWAPPAPLGLPHRVIGDDVYNGHRIPDGTPVIANIWAICRDPSVYQNPLEFNPSRFISSEERSVELDPRKVVFGFGRRVCPGAQFAEGSIFINVVGILKHFDIEKAVDGDGVQITPTVEFTSTITSHIKPFPCSIKERYC